MSIQDKIERIIKQIHVLFSEGTVIPGEENKVIVDKTDIFPILEQLNLAIYELMDQYEATVRSRELAQRKSEKEGKELVERISQQTEDIYAASLIYTDDALNQVQKLMEDALAQSRGIWEQFLEDMEQEKRRVKEDQMELSDQLRDFKDSRKYQVIIEEHNRERERREKELAAVAEKKIKNEAKHIPLNIKPEIKVNPAYFERHKQLFGKEVTMWTEETESPEAATFRDERKEAPSLKTEQESAPATAPAASTVLAGKSALKETAADILGAVLGKTSGSLQNAKGNEPEEEGEDIAPILLPEDFPPIHLEEEEDPNGAQENQDLPPIHLEEEEDPIEDQEKPFAMPEIRVDLNAEYFKWRKGNTGEEGETPEQSPPRKKFFFGGKSGTK